MKFSNSVLFVSVLDGKSKDLLTMKLNEDEWLEYQNVMEDVVKTSGLNKSVFFDVRGNHDNFGVPEVGGSLDFFSKYSINGQLGRTKNVNSVTLQASFATQLAFNNFCFVWFELFSTVISFFVYCFRLCIGQGRGDIW